MSMCPVVQYTGRARIAKMCLTSYQRCWQERQHFFGSLLPRVCPLCRGCVKDVLCSDGGLKTERLANLLCQSQSPQKQQRSRPVPMSPSSWLL